MVLCLMGPTASGKTALAERIAAELPVELISVDSALVYRGMDIGTAKPATPHKLVDILDPSEPYTAARFQRDALAAIADADAAGRIPLLVGGTMLYFRTLFRGLSELPSADPAVRAAISARLAERGSAALHEELARVDPAAAARIHPNDPQRVQRALEVFETTGTPISELQQRRDAPAFDWHKLAVAPAERAVLHDRIETRFRKMLEDGLVAEVAALRARGLDPSLPSMRAVGYRQLWAHLDGEYDLDEAVRRGVFATRQLAKRQLTWLRAEPGLEWLDSGQEGWLDRGVAWARCATMRVR